MGMYAHGILAYGYDLGNEEKWLVEGTTSEFGDLNVTWYDPDADDDFVEAATRRLLTAAGFTETYDGTDGYFTRLHEAEKQLPTEVRMHGYDEAPGYYLTTKTTAVDQGDVRVLDLPKLAREPFTNDWDDKLSAALNALGLTPMQPHASWLLMADYG